MTRLRKGYLSKIFTLSIIFQCGLIASIIAQDQSVFLDDFESGSTSNWTGGQNADRLEVVDDGSGSNKVMRVIGQHADGSTIKWVRSGTDEPTYEDHPIKFSFDYYRDPAYPSNEKFEIGGDENESVGVYIQSGEIFIWRSQTEKSSKVAVDLSGTIHIDFVLNPVTKEAELYVNSSSILTYTYPSDAPGSINYISFSTYAPTGGYFTLDNVQIFGTLKPKSSKANIDQVLLSIPHKDPIIDTTNATVVVPVLSGANITALEPVILVSEGGSISPDSRVVQNFTSPVAYTVTSEVGNTKDWTISLIDTVAVIVTDKHPYLVVTEDMYSELQSRTFNSIIHSNMYNTAEGGWAVTPPAGSWYSMNDQAGSLGLMYILDDSDINRKKYRDKLLYEIGRWDIHEPLLGSDHVDHVIPAGALFNQILALDIMHNDFTNAELEQAYTDLQPIIDWMENDYGPNHVSAQYGVLAAWYLYRYDDANSKIWVDKYNEEIFEIAIHEDGSYTHSPGYMHARLTQNRVAKNGLIDIMDFLGIRDFSNNKQYSDFIDWMNTFSFAPYGDFTRFGETYNYDINMQSIGLLYFAGNYSETGGQNSRWHLENNVSNTSVISCNARVLLNYIQIPLPGDIPRAEMPVSLLKKNSGAALWGRQNSTENLQGILYCPNPPNADNHHHAKYDVNSLMINAYGQPLLANSGGNYNPNYPGLTPDDTRWTKGAYQNIASIGYSAQIAEHGNGLVDGLTGGSVEFGATDANPAYAYANHIRALFLVHESQNNGYFLVLDEVIFENGFNDNYFGTDPAVSLFWQFNTPEETLETVTENTEYSANSNWYQSTSYDGNEKLSVFFGTEPAKSTISSSWKGSFSFPSAKTSKLTSYYEGGSNDTVRIATVLFPEDNTHKKPAMTRISGESYTGVSLQHGDDVVDEFIATSSSGKVDLPFASFKGKSIFTKKATDGIEHFTAYNGKYLKFSEGSLGFESDNSISMQFENNQFIINCGVESEIVLYAPGICGVIEEGNEVELLDKGSNWIKVKLSEGMHTLEISCTTGIKENKDISDKTEVTIYPNPIYNNQFSIRFNKSVTNFSVSIYDLKGMEVFSESYSGLNSNSMKINIDKHLKGIYILHFQNGNTAQTKKISFL